MSIAAISKISTQLMLSEPFYGHFLLGVPKAFDEQRTNTACVSLLNKSTIKLSVNPTYWSSLSPEKQYGLIKHEVLHIVMKHLYTMQNYTNKKLFNIACDLVVNQYITQQQLPEGAIQLSTFDDLETTYGIKLLPLQSTHYYYTTLSELLQNPEKYPNLGKLADILTEDENEALGKHSHWNEFEELDKASKKVMEYQLFNQIKGIMDKFKQNPKLIGSIPGHLVEFINDFLASYRPQVNWKHALKKFATTSSSSFIKNTLRRPSKRYGTTPGIKIKRRSKLLVALDTSGSVSTEDLKKFFGELHQIWKRGAEVTITECDSSIQKTYNYTGVIPDKIHGRGGTSFAPVIALANQTIKPDGIIYFTDGYAQAPTEKSRAAILWIITSDGIKKEDDIWSTLPGKKIKMHE